MKTLKGTTESIYGGYRDTKPDQWVAVDRQKRRVCGAGDEGVPNPNGKIVGIFYWTWHGNTMERRGGATKGGGPYDVSKVLEAYPNALDEPDNPAWGPLEGAAHHWGESVFGYYLDDDEYVIRKHAQMLCDAGVDFIAFDTTNFKSEKRDGVHPGYFRRSTEFLFDTYVKIRSEGKPTPQVTFICPFWDPDSTCVSTMHEDFYSDTTYEPIWFHLEGKPLLLYNREHVAEQKYLDFFTFRRNMPDYHLGPTGTDQWPWLEIYPQHPFYGSDDDQQPEMVSVGVAQNSVVNPEGGWKIGSLSQRDDDGNFIARGRSFHNGRQPQPDSPLFLPEKGFNIEEQWQRAFELDPKAVFVTSWNEWIMGRWAKFIDYENPGGIFVDQFSHEFSRDIEPMKGGHFDDYYYQLINYIRKFKGAREIEKAGEMHSIDIQSFADWDKVKTEYLDDIGDNMERMHPGFEDAGPYFVPKGRHDFVRCKAAHDDVNIYFYVETAEPIKRYLCVDEAWMQLLISIDREDIPSWEGFHFAVNRRLRSSQTSILEAFKGGWAFASVCDIDLHYEQNKMALAVPRRALHLDGKIKLSFKWIDSMAPNTDILELYTHGDTAPNGRFAYRFEEE